ncbi:helix-hairpin-helix domain-containing protein [Bacillus sp. PS06]|uniref:helix-hairpin-helix domain-containing protein n=1 Tax=Bacillus sp. PS06 TaxID=2764176 RepID=UPI00177F7801|nr:helix-hairpin-helix domain-containing protein [Bacillus sp. PS06]MBD8069219.1 helix-hairpin-helix domain-containing protein [Bacillus sp. PS06]
MFNKRFSKKIILGACAAIMLVGMFTYSNFRGKGENVQEEEFFPLDEEVTEIEADISMTEISPIMVDVKGEVLQPGVYEFDTGERIQDAIRQAGGFTEDADVLTVNLAAILIDEMVIYVPKIGEVREVVVDMKSSQGGDDKISINTATVEELQQLTGIGPAKAAAIKKYKDENGPLKNVEELLNVAGIGEKTLEKLRDEITIR